MEIVTAMIHALGYAARLPQRLAQSISITKSKSSFYVSAEYSTSNFDVIISNQLAPHAIQHDTNLLSQYLKLVKPNGNIIITTKLGSKTEFLSTLKTAGLLFTESDAKVDETNVLTVVSRKPNFEVGSSVKLSFAKKTPVASVWKIDDTVEDDIIDPDSLLDEEDFKKPDPASLKVCGTTGKRKACKDCSCGLAEELATEVGSVTPKSENAKSSCGSVSLNLRPKECCIFLGLSRTSHWL